MIDCPRHVLSSPEFLKITFHVITIIAIPIHTFGFYCIIRKTPKHMDSVKMLLFNLHCWCVLLDIAITVFGIPYIFLPALAGYQLGFVDAPALVFYLVVTFLTGVSTSIFVIYENRYHILFGRNCSWRFFRKYCIVLSYCLVPLYFVAPIFSVPEQETARKIVWESLSCAPEIPEGHFDFFVISLNIRLMAITIAIAEGVPFFQILIFFSLNFYNLILARQPSGLSRKTTQMQNRLVLALFVQSSVTFVIFLVPVNGIILFVYTGYHNQILNNFVFLAFASHGTVIMVVAHKPYRQFFSLLSIRSSRKATIMVVNSDVRL
ncbi:Protein CBR-SRH-239 [Caenorhabditis briggsae]|uniref:Protein CBR-SRH-239 n=1 Tax=Caenorhabditis briggsae TaxID=6238 RepID=A8WQC8_CAEBR|nr:Protein CBR-SRH-239 [Caenorhabditis briggsae]CAP22686.1 Protein CBR-SRH-239 [Caenorhabditis briggsae]